MNLPTQTDLKIITRIWNVVEKQGISIAIMAFTVWVFYGLFQEQAKQNNDIRREQNERYEKGLEEMREEIKGLTDYSRNVLQEVVVESTEAMNGLTEEIRDLKNNKD